MPATIKLPTPLRRHADQAKTVEVPVGTVAQALQALVEAHPAMQGAIYDGTGEIKPFVRVFVGPKDIADLNGPATVLGEGDVLSIIP
ncbi:MAG: MoaD/ThiS family protein, partial [Planctomycetota bacterium]|nr:MoaD/ThiS family protein [Planctomycetota bacterium]